MKNRIHIIIIGTLLATACSISNIKTSWSKPGAQPGEFEEVSAKCEQDRGMAGLGGDANFQVCMKQNGWFLIEETVQ